MRETMAIDATPIIVALIGLFGVVLGGGGVAAIRESVKASREREEAWREEYHHLRDNLLPVVERQTELLETMLREWGVK